MDNLLIFFAFPVAVIIFSIALQKILRSPILVAAIIFAIFLIVTFAAFDETFLVYAILYSLLALITSLITRFICCLIRNSANPCITSNAGISDDMNENDNLNCSCNSNSNCNGNSNSNSNCNCNSNSNCNRNYITPYSQKRNIFRR